MKTNPFESRLDAMKKTLSRKKLDAIEIRGEANIRALTGIECDNAILLVTPSGVLFHTDFRYIPMVHREAPWLRVKDIKKISYKAEKIGYETSLTVAQFKKMQKRHPRAKFVDILGDVDKLRMVKTPQEIAALKAAEELNDEIWRRARAMFAPGMTEREMARKIQHLMIDMGDGEAFATIVCVGRNAAECHHVPDDTVWHGTEPVLVDMGVKLNGYCSDMTRNIVPAQAGAKYRQVYEDVLGANMAAIAAAKPGMKAFELDKVARDYLKERGWGKEFGHSLGHGVGVQIHEMPFVAEKRKEVLKPGVVHTIEPGVYIENELGVRIEDMVVITEDGCEVLSHSEK